MNKGLELFKSIVLITSPDQIEQETWFEADVWQIASWVEGDTYFYICIPIIKLNNLYHA